MMETSGVRETPGTPGPEEGESPLREAQLCERLHAVKVARLTLEMQQSGRALGTAATGLTSNVGRERRPRDRLQAVAPKSTAAKKGTHERRT